MLRESFVQAGIDAVVGDQFVMGSTFDDFPVIEYDDQISVADGAEAMRDDKCCPAVEKNLQSILQTQFCGAVDAAGGLVQNQN